MNNVNMDWTVSVEDPLFELAILIEQKVMKERCTGEYDFWELCKAGNEERLNLCGEYDGGVLTQIKGKGRGFVAFKDTYPGELIMACRAEEIAFSSGSGEDVEPAVLNMETQVCVVDLEL